MQFRNYYVYILTNRTEKVMYIGVTNDHSEESMSIKTAYAKVSQGNTTLINSYISKKLPMSKVQLQEKNNSNDGVGRRKTDL